MLENTKMNENTKYREVLIKTVVTNLFLAATRPCADHSDTMFHILSKFVDSERLDASKLAVDEERAKTIKNDLRGERERIIQMIREEERKRAVEILMGMDELFSCDKHVPCEKCFIKFKSNMGARLQFRG